MRKILRIIKIKCAKLKRREFTKTLNPITVVKERTDSKKTKTLRFSNSKYICFIFLIGNFIFLHAQSPNNTPILVSDNVSQYISGFSSSTNKTRNKQAVNTAIKISANETLSFDLVTNKQDDEMLKFIGTVNKNENSSFRFTHKNGKMKGHIIQRDINKAYKLFTSTDSKVYIKETDINSILCVGYTKCKTHNHEKTKSKSKPSTITSLQSPYTLQSRPSATAVIYLDFDGEVVTDEFWDNGNTIDAQPAGFTNQQIIETWEIMAEDFSPFNINVVTDRSVFEATPINRRMMCIFTSTYYFEPNSGGNAYLESFYDSEEYGDTPCWVFNIDSAKDAGDTGSHEIGHTMGLLHDGIGRDEYYDGHNNWAPIMGFAISKPISHWSNGDYSNASNTEDDVQIMAGPLNGFGFSPDDHSNTINGATPLSADAGGIVSASQNYGIIEMRTDIDMFSFESEDGQASFTINPHTIHPNLDIQVRLLDENQNQIAISNPTGLSASITENLSAGNYYLEIQGVGTGDPDTGYSDYSSLGQFSISGQVNGDNTGPPPTDTTPPVITLNGDNPMNLEVFSPYIEPGATANDNVDGDITASIAYTGTVNFNVIGSYNVFYNVSDNAGNPANQVTRTVNIIAPPDNTPPVITLNGDNPMNLTVGTPYIEPGATVNDNVDGLSNLDPSGITGTVNFNVIGTYLVNYNTTDAANNPANQVTRTVNVIAPPDNTPPVITLNGDNPMNLTVDTPYIEPGATVNDNVDGFSNLDPSGITGTVNFNVIGTYLVNYNTTDAAGNAATQVTRTVNVTAAADTTPPVITLNGDNPMNLTVGTPYTEPGATVNDNVDGLSNLDPSGITGTVDFNVVGTYFINYNTTDAANNPADQVTRTVNVTPAPDTTPPVITLNGDNPLTLTVGSTYIEPGAIVTDNVDGVSNISPGGILGNVNTNIVGNYLVSYNTIDAAGNPAVQVLRDVIVTAAADTTPPVITLIGDNPMTLTVGTPYIELGATVNDNIDGPSNLDPTGITGNVNFNVIGSYFVTYNTNDAAGNPAAQVTRTVNVTAAPDTTPPVITLNGDNPMSLPLGTPYTEPGATVNDNIDGPSNLDPSGITGTVDFNTVGTYFVNYNTTDAAGNPAAQITRTVNVTAAPDTTPPVITLNGDNPMNLTVGTPYTEPGATVNDNVDGASNISPTGITGTVDFNTVGTYFINYNTNDAAGNPADQVTRTVNVTAANGVQTSYINPIAQIPGLIEGEYYDQGGQDIAYNDDGIRRGTRSFRPLDNVDVAAHPQGSNGYIVGYGETGEWLEYTVDVLTENYDITLYYFSGDTPGDLQISLDGSVVSTISGMKNGDWSIQQTITATNVALTGGNAKILRLEYVNGARFDIDAIDFKVATPAPPTNLSITLLGDNPINLDVGDTYIEQGATASDNQNNDYSADIVITGTVDTNIAGTYTVYYNVTDNEGNTANEVTRTIIVSTPIIGTQTPYLNPIAQIPGLIEGEYYDQGGQGVAYNDDGIRRGDKTFRPLDNVDVAAHPQGSNGYIVGYGATGEWLEYTVDVTPGNYDITLYYFSGHKPGELQISLDGTVVSTISGMVNGNWSIQKSITIKDVPLTGGNAKTLRLEYVNGSRFDIDAIDFQVATPTPPTNLTITLLGDNPVNIDVDENYMDQGATASDDLNADYTSDIVITGNVDTSTAGTYTLYYNVTDNDGNTANEVTRTIIVNTPTPEIQAPNINSQALIPGIIEGEYYDQGGQGIAYNDDNTKSGERNFRPQDNVDVAAHNQASNGYIVGYGATGEWLEYTVDVTPGNYDITLYYFSGHQPGELQISLDGTVVCTIGSMENGNWDIQKSITVTDVALTGGNAKILRLEYLNGARFDIDAIEFKVATGPMPSKSPKSSSTNTTEDSGNALKESNNAKEKKVTIYPNPVSETLYINFTDANTLKQIRVYSLTGQLLYSDEVNTQSTSIPVKTIGARESTVTVLIESGTHRSFHKIILR